MSKITDLQEQLINITEADSLLEFLDLVAPIVERLDEFGIYERKQLRDMARAMSIFSTVGLDELEMKIFNAISNWAESSENFELRNSLEDLKRVKVGIRR